MAGPRTWWGRVNSWLERRQQAAWPLLLLVLLMLAAGFGVLLSSVGRDLLEFHRAGRRNQISLASPPVPLNLPTANLVVGAKDSETADAEANKNEIPRIDWHTDARLRQAAALLAKEGDLEGALGLLMQGAASDESVRAIGTAAFATLKYNFEPVVSSELRALRRYWEKLSLKEKAAYFVQDGQAKQLKLEVLLGSNSPTRNLADYGKVLPGSLLFCLMGNIHAELAKQTKCPASVIELVLEAEFPGRGLAKRLYWGPKFAARTPYPEHFFAFNQAFNRRYIWPRFRELLLFEKKELALAAKRQGAWYTQVCGEKYCRALADYRPEKTAEAGALQLWLVLPDPLKKLWADYVYEGYLAKHNLPLAPTALGSNPWLGQAADRLDKAFLLQTVRTHPAWQKALREFNHERAMASVPAILKRLRATKHHKTVWQGLLSPLNYERTELIKQSFSWHYLARRFGVVEGVPPGILAQRAKARGRKYTPEKKTKGRRWLDVPPRRVYTALRNLATLKNNEARYRIIAKNYAVNRGLNLKTRN